MKYKYAGIDLKPIAYKAASVSQHTRYRVSKNLSFIADIRIRFHPGSHWACYDHDDKEVLRTDKKEELWASIKRHFDTESFIEYMHVDPISHCYHTLDLLMKGVIENCDANQWIGFYDCPTNSTFRYHIARICEYKGGRPEKPRLLEPVKYRLMEKYGAIETQAVEADDMLAIEQWEKGDDFVLCSNDKDFLQIPGPKFNFDYERDYGAGHFSVQPDDALRHLFVQVLQGDRVDNIPGLPGIGEKKACKILAGETTAKGMFKRCLSEFENTLTENQLNFTSWTGEEFKYTPEEYLFESLMLVKLLDSRETFDQLVNSDLNKLPEILHNSYKEDHLDGIYILEEN